MFHAKNRRPFLAVTLLAFAGLTAACESSIEREMRLEREALKKSGELEELQNQVDTVNPDPYAESGTRNIGRFKKH